MTKTIKELICEWLNCCGKEKWLLSVMGKKNEGLSSIVTDQDETIKQLEKDRNDAYDDADSLKEQLDLCQQAHANPTHVPEKSIKYRRNVYLGGTKGWVTKAISVRNFITINDDEIKKQIKSKRLFISGDPDKFDKEVVRVYHAAEKRYKYIFDDGYGFAENWWFPFELDVALDNNLGGDCEDYAHKVVTWMRIAGVLADRVFVSCGTTRSGFGHSTIYVRDSTGIWRHLNSTLPHLKHKDLKSFPSKDDTDDTIGIKEDGFWFSFNDRISINDFETEEAKRFFEEEEAMNKVTIQ